MSGVSRHKACNHCRERKIRCDGHQPCQRCRGSGDDCRYTPKWKAAKPDFTQALEIFNERLLQAETALAAQRNTPAPTHPSFPADAFEQDSFASWSQLLGVRQPSTEQNLGSVSNNGQVAAQPMTIPSGLDFNELATYTLPPVPPFQQPSEPFSPTNTALPALSTADITPFGNTTSSDGWKDPILVGSQSSTLQHSGSTSGDWSSFNTSSRITTFQTYSQTVHHYFSMIDGHRLQSRTDETPVSSELIALQYVIWAHAAMFIPQYSYLSDKLYLQARMRTEITEAANPQKFFTIPALQTLILIALYELKQTYFTRSWVSVSRATWLAHSLGLQKMDRSGLDPANDPLLNFLPCTDDPTVLEERRRTFWAMLQINCVSTVGICWNLGMGFDLAEISTYLPVDDLDEQNPGHQMALGDVFRSSMAGHLCPLQGAALVASLCIRCVSHVSQINKEYSFESPTYDFWTHHYRLNELIDHVSYTALAHLKPNEHLTDPNILSLNMILQATIICLHQAVIFRVSKLEKHRAYSSIISKSEQRCIEATLDFVDTVRYISRITTVKMNPYVTWTFYVVLQYLVRKAQADPSPKPTDGWSRIPPSITPYSSPVTSPAASYQSRKPSMNTSDRFGAFRSGPSEGFITSNSSSSTDRPTIPNKCVNSPAVLDSARILDLMHSLRSRLNALKATIPLARVFEAQINEEIESGEAGTRERLVGLARFLPAPEEMLEKSNVDV
ncbi:MAG: hypothetical protein Q9216_004469 [Gyalolechia sp. 2 TL-2023]